MDVVKRLVQEEAPLAVCYPCSHSRVPLPRLLDIMVPKNDAMKQVGVHCYAIG